MEAIIEYIALPVAAAAMILGVSLLGFIGACELAARLMEALGLD